MRQKFRLNWFDLFMLFLAALPFAVIWAMPGLGKLGGLASFLVIPIYLIFVSGCVGFPAASILYFVWRLKDDKNKNEELPALKTDAQVCGSIGR